MPNRCEPFLDVRVDVVESVEVGEEPQHLVHLHARGQRQIARREPDPLHRLAARPGQQVTEQLDAPPVGGDDAEQHQQRGGLAGSVGAEKRDPLPGRDCEVDPGDGLSPPERLLQPQRSDDELHEGEVSPVQGSARVCLSNVLSQVAAGGWAGVK